MKNEKISPKENSLKIASFEEDRVFYVNALTGRGGPRRGRGWDFSKKSEFQRADIFFLNLVFFVLILPIVKFGSGASRLHPQMEHRSRSHYGSVSTMFA
jgi:hypothetical protein